MERIQNGDSKDGSSEGSEAGSVVIHSGHVFQVISDFHASEEGDLTVKAGESVTILSTRSDGWWEAKNWHGETGLIPSTFLKITDEEPYHGAGNRSGKELWSILRNSFKRSRSVVSDVLQAFGALPPGIRPSFLNQLELQDSHCSMSCYLTPRLSESNLAYHDLFWNKEGNKLRKRKVKVLKVIKLIKCENITTEFSGLTTIHYHVRTCLFDGNGVRSNIHSVKAQYQSKKSNKQWIFLDRISDKQSSIEMGEFMLRSNYANSNVKLLVEVGVSFIRESNKKYGELSCGWTMIPLLRENGDLEIEDKTLTLPLSGGTPFQPESFLSSETMGASEKKLRQMMAANKQPRVIVKISSPTQQQREFADQAPDVLIWNSLVNPFVAYYRRLLGEALLRNREDTASTELMFDPVVTACLKVFEQPDLVDLMRHCWSIREKALTKELKKSEEDLSNAFRCFINDTMVAFDESVVIPTYCMGKQSDLTIRLHAISKFLEVWNREKSGIDWLMSNDIAFTPLYLENYSFNVIGSHSLG